MPSSYILWLSTKAQHAIFFWNDELNPGEFGLKASHWLAVDIVSVYTNTDASESVRYTFIGVRPTS